MYCWNCGKEMEDDLLFCPHCAMKQAGVPEPKEKKKVPLLPIVCIAACILVLLMTGLILVGINPAEEPPDPYSVELPDLASFLNTQYTNDDVSQYTHHVTCRLKDTYGLEAVEEYLKLLEKKKYQLTCEDSWTTTEKGVEYRDIIFRYGGKNQEIRWVSHREGYKYHVKLSIRHDEKKGDIQLTLYTAHGFRLVDPGVDAKAVK